MNTNGRRPVQCDGRYPAGSAGSIVRISWKTENEEMPEQTDIKGLCIYPDSELTLDGCLAIALAHGYDKEENGTVVVISETALSGEVFRYGNHGDYWEAIGTVCGYA